MPVVFSIRTAWDRAVNPLTRLLEEKRRHGAPVLDLTASNPTRVGISYPSDLLAPLGDPAGLSYAPSPAGLAIAREAVAEDYRRRGQPVSPGQVLITASTSEAYAFLFKLLCEPGDEVLVPRPSYPLFDYLAGLESVRVAPYALAFDGEWHLPASAVSDVLTQRTRAVVVVHPNNPTGSFLKRDEADALHALCAARGLALISDEVFADYDFAPDPRRYPGAAEEGAALAFAMGGLSKSCGLPQLKIGWMVASGPAEARAEALARLEVVADTYLSVSTPAQLALPSLLRRRPELLDAIRQRVRGNREWLPPVLTGTAASWPAAEGGWYAVLHVPASLTDEERALRLLAEHDVLVHPGYFFDFAGEGHLVVSLLTPPSEFQEGVRRLIGVL
jgi:aspartate/methionine/tyrosine aminotransferase